MLQTATPVKRSRDEASKLLGQKMLQGWTMLGNSCPVEDCYTPLMRSRQGKVGRALKAGVDINVELTIWSVLGVLCEM
ncbi:hypothetical protein BBO99_00001663 [Phytophthora kernoviae]|uniref:Uncharacterized protein n=2 Tax=Phytophthora kernoviae TaxID=325452 RepID=A0A421GYL1_9STRA|nr:hypothetical protein G195_009056 [Phytophthora kernoviae 00238/432]KAG2512329.1 hypothetical protein JM16_008129 [Phytophthora kernoviae]KAG2519674.1 hypothetical protein JM18_007387 [Phytophthora kernoviae]RLN31836.1 hypothetical protein BBI17_000486 [Phytophthora kernoviae]RLN83932.1 hypothetical protein BBO99_00001663 [Phytophthora kernoviae]